MVFNYGWAPQLFGARRKGGRRHAGIDLGTSGRKGVPVGCPIDGFRVASVSRRGGYGNTVDLVSEDGTKMMRFAHLANPLPKHLKVGEPVHYGDWLGDVGNTGGNYAIHLHFEYRVKKNGKWVPVNPFNNPYQEFSQQIFENSTKLAKNSRASVRAGKSLADTHGDRKPASATMSTETTTNTEAASSPVEQNTDVWSLDRGFGQPTWWERNMPEFLGGWSKKDLEKAEQERKLDEEVFKGIRRRDLLNAGLSEQDISKLQTHVNTQVKMRGQTLREASVPVDFTDFYSDKETAQKAIQFFRNHNKDRLS